MGSSSASLIHGDVIAFGATPKSYSLNQGGPVIVTAWRVEISGVVSSGGQNVTIIAREVAFLTPDARIDTSGPDAPNSWSAGNKPQRPGDGGTDTNGSDGTAGIAGLPGGDAGNVTIYATRIKGKLDILAQGGTGGRPQDGGDGSNGGSRSRPPAEPGNECVGLRGERGTSGGNGGLPGAAGRSGNGGNVDVYLSTSVDVLQPSSVALSLKGGAAADLAVGGQQGHGGPPGQSPACTARPLPGRPAPTGRPGVQGPDGSPAPAQHPSVPGTGGLFCGKPANTPAPPWYPLTDSGFAAQCTSQQLWDILQAAEGFYLNDDLQKAAPRLAWVSMMGRLLGLAKVA